MRNARKNINRYSRIAAAGPRKGEEIGGGGAAPERDREPARGGGEQPAGRQRWVKKNFV